MCNILLTKLNYNVLYMNSSLYFTVFSQTLSKSNPLNKNVSLTNYISVFFFFLRLKLGKCCMDGSKLNVYIWEEKSCNISELQSRFTHQQPEPELKSYLLTLKLKYWPLCQILIIERRSLESYVSLQMLIKLFQS